MSYSSKHRFPSKVLLSVIFLGSFLIILQYFHSPAIHQPFISGVTERCERNHTKSENMTANPNYISSRLYLDLLRDTLVGQSLATRELAVRFYAGSKDQQSVLQRLRPYNANKRYLGLDWPFIGLTMIGTQRMIEIEMLLRNVTDDNIEGDFIECGVWRGGASIFARGVLNVLQRHDVNVWLVDSFAGLPPRRQNSLRGPRWETMDYLAVSIEEVSENFKNFAMLPAEFDVTANIHVHDAVAANVSNHTQSNVRFVKGFFKDSLPTLPKNLKISVARLDGDMYQSTLDELYYLYDKISLGGWIIIDDWCVPETARAIVDFTKIHQIQLPLHLPMFKNYRCGAFFQKTKNVTLDWSLYNRTLQQTPNK